MDSTASKSNEISKNVRLYLIVYNLLQTTGWIFILILFANFMILHEYNALALWKTVKWIVLVFQSAALIEVIHVIIGYVRSNAVITLLQVLSRVLVVFLLFMVPTSQSTIGVPLLLVAWSITEIIRYSFYACHLLSRTPLFLKWLRYSTFIILYPIGVTGELLCIYASQKYSRATNLFSIQLPNMFNVIFSFTYFLWFIIFIYIPVFPKLYSHMLSQRKKALHS